MGVSGSGIGIDVKPIVFDLFCGLGGWTEAFLAEGYRAVGFDIEAHDYGKGGYPGEFILRDIRSISGSELVREFGVPTCIVASPPCQEFSYMAMPWSKAKEKRRKILADQSEQKRLTDLFNQCFRIQREVCEAAGVYIPMVVENVRGAQEWVGKARWNFGSYYLWGDVPALMPIPARIGSKGIGHSPNGHWTNPAEHESGSKGNWLGRDPDTGKRIIKGQRSTGSNSKARKEASAMIAKIPFVLAAWIAKTFKPNEKDLQ